MAELKQLGKVPYSFRRSIYVDDPKVHDFVTKKRYTVLYEVDEDKQTVTILGIFKYKIWRV